MIYKSKPKYKVNKNVITPKSFKRFKFSIEDIIIFGSIIILAFIAVCVIIMLLNV